MQKIIYLDDPLKRDFYTEMCRLENWSTRTLQKKIQSMLFERTALSKKPDKLIRQELDALKADDKLTPDLVFRDPYVLDFLGLADTYSEKDLERAILREMESFILELGVGFCFVERQKRMQIDNEDYYLDLLFYHRKLRRAQQRARATAARTGTPLAFYRDGKVELHYVNETAASAANAPAAKSD